MECVLETGYGVFTCLEHRSGVIASSWFYIHGEENEQPWKVEHQGMPRLMVVSERHQGLLLQVMTRTITLHLSRSAGLILNRPSKKWTLRN